MMITAVIFTMLQCTPGDTYCGLVDDGGGKLMTFPTVEACRASAAAQTRSYEEAGSHGYHGLCVSRDVGQIEWQIQ